MVRTGAGTGADKTNASAADGRDAAAGRDQASTTSPLDGTAPSPVTGLRATVSGSAIRLSWSASKDSQSGVRHYNVYRGDHEQFDARYLTLAGQPVETSFEESGLEAGKRAWYKVEAEDACGNRSGHYAVVYVEVK